MSQDTQAPAPLRSTSRPSSPGALERDQAWRVASNLFVSFGFAWAGITYAFRTQRNFKIHVFMGLFALSLALILQLPPVEIAVMGLTVGGVMTMELLNTALESVVDLTVQQTYHELAKIAKDCAAGAVLISALVSIIVAVSLLVPPLLDRLLALI